MEYVSQICAVLALVLAYFAISREGREDLKSSIKRGLGFLKQGIKGLTVLAFLVGLLAIAIDSFMRIEHFKTAQAPVTRPEIVDLLFNAFNFGMYSVYSAVALWVVARLVIKRIRGATHASSEVEKESPSEEGLSG